MHAISSLSKVEEWIPLLPEAVPLRWHDARCRRAAHYDFVMTAAEWLGCLPLGECFLGHGDLAGEQKLGCQRVAGLVRGDSAGDGAPLHPPRH